MPTPRIAPAAASPDIAPRAAPNPAPPSPLPAPLDGWLPERWSRASVATFSGVDAGLLHRPVVAFFLVTPICSSLWFRAG